MNFIGDKVKIQMLKSLMLPMLPSIKSLLPGAEIHISDYIRQQPLQDGESRAVVMVYNKENAGLTVALVAVNDDDAPVRIIQQSGLIGFINQLILNFK